MTMFSGWLVSWLLTGDVYGNADRMTVFETHKEALAKCKELVPLEVTRIMLKRVEHDMDYGHHLEVRCDLCERIYWDIMCEDRTG